MVFPQVIAEDNYVCCFTKGSPLTEKFNAAIKEMESSGKLDELKEYWVDSSGEKTLEPQKSQGKNGTVKIAIDPSFEPMIYLNGDGEIIGYDIAVCNAICDMLDIKAEYVFISRDAFVEYVSSGKADMSCGAVSITEERSKVMDFSLPTYNGGIVFLVRKDACSAEISGIEGTSSQSFGDSLNSFFEDIKNSFVKTFITENRWKLILNGLLVTILISLCAFVLGSVLGGVVCAMLRSRKKPVSLFARGYIRLLQGTPIIVLLMILYYVILKDVDISAIIVAIIGFSLNLAAYTSEIFRTAINAVDKGQIEAAYAIGFNKTQTFFKIILPQAAKNALPVYKGEFISLVKATSIVGYIAIQDLTKASDIIRSRTYEAFFPLITTAVIYFAVTYLFIVLLNALERKIDPKRRKRTLKGVDCK
ncbi:MAG: ABC transporter substrate-binding protein/permease [Ruminiclostridium sp.]